jgi:hypothetical protein
MRFQTRPKKEFQLLVKSSFFPVKYNVCFGYHGITSLNQRINKRNKNSAPGEDIGQIQHFLWRYYRTLVKRNWSKAAFFPFWANTAFFINQSKIEEIII